MRGIEAQSHQDENENPIEQDEGHSRFQKFDRDTHLDPRLTSSDKQLMAKLDSVAYAEKTQDLRQQSQDLLTELHKNGLLYKEEVDFRNRLHTTSFEEQENIWQQLKQKQQELKDQKAQEAEDSKKLDINNPEIQKTVSKINKYVDDHVTELGKDAAEEFKKWALKQIKKDPSKKTAEDTFSRLKDPNNQEGIEIRIRFYKSEVLPVFEELGIRPQDSKVIRLEGRSEKKAHLKNIEDQRTHFEQLKEVGLYNDKVIKEALQEIALADSKKEQEKMIQKAINIGRIEQNHQSRLDTEVTIHGVTFKAFRNKKYALDKHADLDWDDSKNRIAWAEQWPKTITAEENLAKEFEKDTEKLPEELKGEAVKAYINTEKYEDRVELKKKYKKMSETAEKEKIEYEMVKDQAIGKIKTCDALSVYTRENYQAFFKEEKNFKDPKTKKPGSLKIMKKAYKILVDPIPSHKYKNLAAYTQRKQEFDDYMEKAKKLAEGNKKEEKWLNEQDQQFQEGGWKTRAKIAPKVIVKYKALEAKNKEDEQIDEKLGTKGKKEKKEGIEQFTRTEVIKLAQENLDISKGKPNAHQALDYLRDYDKLNPGDPKIRFLMKQAMDMLYEFGDAGDDKATNELVEQAEDLMSSDETLARKVLEHRVETKTAEDKERAKQQEGVEEAEEVAKRKSVEALKSKGKHEAALDAETYQDQEKGKIVTKEGKVTEIQTTTEGEETTKEDLTKMAKTVARGEGKRIRGEVNPEIKMKNKSNQELSADRAKDKVKEDRTDIAKEIRQKAEERYRATHSTGENESFLGEVDNLAQANQDIEKKLEEETQKILREEEANA